MAREPFVNEQIREDEVRVISEDGEQLGIMSRNEALQKAYDNHLDLVNISPRANPPVTKIMDYGKYRYEQEKKAKEARRNQKTIEVKEMRLSPTIERHDLEVKARHVRRFLDAGDKVKVSIRFRGREMAHTDQGRGVMDEFLDMLDDVANVERQPRMEGRQMFMILAPMS